jgi:hypothetical protein
MTSSCRYSRTMLVLIDRTKAWVSMNSMDKNKPLALPKVSESVYLPTGIRERFRVNAFTK